MIGAAPLRPDTKEFHDERASLASCLRHCGQCITQVVDTGSQALTQ